jgi:hypothetical protein
MKQLLAMAAFLLIGGGLFAQTQTLFGNADVKGAFGGPLLEFSEVNGEFAVDVGGGGALVINDFFLGGYGMGTTFNDVTVGEKDYTIQFGHGGFWLGYVYKPEKIVHVYSQVKTGWGNIRLLEEPNDDKDDAAFRDAVYVLTPELGLEINVTKFLKVALTGGYRWVADVDNTPGGLTQDDFNSWQGGISFRIGGF